MLQDTEESGGSDKMMKSAVARQVGIYFAAPLVLAVFYTILSLRVVMEKVSTFYNMEIRTSMIVTLLVLLLIYGGYYVATSTSCKRMVFHGKGWQEYEKELLCHLHDRTGGSGGIGSDLYNASRLNIFSLFDGYDAC